MPLVEFSASDPPTLERIRAALERYAEPLLQSVAARLIRSRNQWPADELRQRVLAALADPVHIDRSLRTLSPVARKLLKLVAISRQPRWPVRSLVDLLNALGPEQDISAVRELLECGLVFPELPAPEPAVVQFAAWLQQAADAPLAVIVLPLAAGRARNEDLGLPTLPHTTLATAAPLEPDGLEWPLRLAALWQFVRSTPLRRTQQGGFFKRDLDRLRSHPLLSAPPAEAVETVPDPGLLAMSLAHVEGVVTTDNDQTRAGEFPAHWGDGLGPALVSLWSALAAVEDWEPTRGWTGSRSMSRAFAATAVHALALLAQVPPAAWVRAADAESGLAQGPDAVAGAGEAFLLGLGHQLRLVQVAWEQDAHWVRLGPLGRALAEGAKQLPAERLIVEQTLIVQPNLEIVLFRQGLTPGLIVRLAHFAEWKALGLACTLTLTAESVYQGLESGETLAGILALLERHGTRALSETVLGSLRSWASKRERVQVFPSALLLEFRTAADLDRALRQGLVERKITDRIGLIASEDRIAYNQFRFIGTRDYHAPDELCAEVVDDGLTLAINENRSDLLLESEVRRVAEPIASAGTDERPRYRITPALLRSVRDQGMEARALDAWFLRRTGGPTPAAARLLMSGDEYPAPALERLVVLRVPTAELADGIAVWSETAGLIAERLGPTLLAVRADVVEELRAKLAGIGVRVADG